MDSFHFPEEKIHFRVFGSFSELSCQVRRPLFRHSSGPPPHFEFPPSYEELRFASLASLGAPSLSFVSFLLGGMRLGSSFQPRTFNRFCAVSSAPVFPPTFRLNCNRRLPPEWRLHLRSPLDLTASSFRRLFVLSSRFPETLSRQFFPEDRELLPPARRFLRGAFEDFSQFLTRYDFPDFPSWVFTIASRP